MQLRLDRFAGIERVDAEAGLVTVRAGTPLHQLNDELWQVGLAMTNLGDIDAQTISGAISTGTHGTGARYGGLATQVHALELVDAAGRLLTCSAEENPELFAAARIGLGALGVIATVTLRCEPAFALAAAEGPAELDDTLAELDELVATNDHFEFYWFPHTRRVLTKRNNRVRPGTPLQPVGRVRGYVDDELLANTVFGALNKLTTRRPSLIPRTNRVAAGALSARDYVDRSYRVFTSHRSRPVPRDGVRRAARRAARCARRHPALSRRQRRADRLPDRGAVRRGRRRLAVHRVRPRHRVRRRAPVHRARLRAVLPRGGGRSRAPSTAARTGASCTSATPRRCARPTRTSTTSSRCATGSTRSAASATATCAACSVRDA